MHFGPSRDQMSKIDGVLKQRISQNLYYVEEPMTYLFDSLMI